MEVFVTNGWCHMIILLLMPIWPFALKTGGMTSETTAGECFPDNQPGITRVCCRSHLLHSTAGKHPELKQAQTLTSATAWDTKRHKHTHTHRQTHTQREREKHINTNTQNFYEISLMFRNSNTSSMSFEWVTLNKKACYRKFISQLNKHRGHRKIFLWMPPQ